MAARAGPRGVDVGLIPALWTYLRPQARSAAVMGACLVASAGFSLLGPQILARFIDAVAHGGRAAPIAALIRLAALFLAATLAAQVARTGGVYLSARVGWSATNRLRHDLAAHCLDLDMAFHSARTPGAMIERIDGDVSTLASFFSQFVFQVLGSGLLLIGILGVLLLRAPLVGAALGIFSIAAFLILRRTQGLAVAPFAAEREARSELAGFIEERLGGLDDIRANGGGAHVMRGLGALNTTLTDTGIRAIKRAQIYIVLISAGVFVLGYGLALGLGVWLFLHGRASLGSVYLLTQYAAMMRAPLESLGAQMSDLQRVMASLGRIRELRALTPAIVGGAEADWPRMSASVAFEHVSFAYDAEPVLNEVAFDLEAGETLGLLGRTGAGKTTIAKLLCRLYDPAAGRVLLGGRDIRAASLTDLRAHVGVVSQDVQIFRASVRDNLTVFDPGIADARIVEIMEEVGLGPWLGRQPRGLDTLVAGGLSAGEAQLLAFARVFLKDPGLVILDEASSRLDPATERLLDRAMAALLCTAEPARRRTAIVIAHKLETVARLDRIMIIEAGAVVEQGRRSVLAADPGSRFSALLAAGMAEALA